MLALIAYELNHRRLCNERQELGCREFEIAIRRQVSDCDINLHCNALMHKLWDGKLTCTKFSQLARFVQNQMAKAMRMTDVAQVHSDLKFISSSNL